MNIPKSVSPKYRPRVLFWDDERKQGNSLIVTLNYGWFFTEETEHVRGFDTVKEAAASIKDSQRCTCPECNAQRTYM
jgi:hypothetical protein